MTNTKVAKEIVKIAKQVISAENFNAYIDNGNLDLVVQTSLEGQWNAKQMKTIIDMWKDSAEKIVDESAEVITGEMVIGKSAKEDAILVMCKYRSDDEEELINLLSESSKVDNIYYERYV